MMAPFGQFKVEWSERDMTKVAPKRSGHTAMTTATGERQFIFGGYVEESATKRYVKNDLWEWKETTGWTSLEQIGDIPDSRLVSAAGQIGDQIYLFGGWKPGDNDIILDTVHQLDPKTNKWTQLDVTIPGGPTSRLVALSMPDQKILLHNHRSSDYVLLFDGQKFAQQDVVGDIPSSRGLHAACSLPNGNIVVFGGADKSGSMSNELFILDVTKWSWTKVEASKLSPSPRAASSLCSFDQNCVIMFGGAEIGGGGLNPKGDVWAMHLESGKWELLWDEEETGGPPPRNAATLSLLRQDECSKEFILTGGWAPFRETWDDCFVMRIQKK